MSLPVLTAAVGAPAWLAARDPRLRLLAALAFALLVVNLERPPALAAAVAGSLLLALSAGLGPRRLLGRLLVLEGFMVVVLAFLPFSVPGQAWFRLGPLEASREGAWLALVIVLRAHAVVLAALALLGTLTPAALGHGLARLRVPERLVHLLLFTVRYIAVVQGEYRRLRLAMRARAFTPRSDRHTWRTLGYLVGMLLVRSLERSRRVLAAMKCRGFDGRLFLLDDGRWRPADTAAAAVAAAALGALAGLEWGL